MTMLETIPEGLVNLDKDYRFLYVNHAAERILDQKREDLIGALLWEKFPDLCGTDFEHELRRVINEQATSDFQGYCTREQLEYQISICPCQAGAMVLLKEATPEKKLREALEESEAWRRLIIQNVRDFAIFSMDVNGRVTLWNPGAERIFGHTSRDMIGNRTDVIFVPEERAAGKPEQELTEARESGRARDERWHLRKDGTRLFVSGTVVPLRDRDGTLRGFTKVAKDMTATKMLEDELRNAQQHLEEVVAERTARLEQTVSELELFWYTISHDLRAPLRAMRSFAQILALTAREKLDTRSMEYVDRIVAAADRLDRLIQDVLDYSRVNRADIGLEPVDLETAVDIVIREHPSLDLNKARIEVIRPLGSVLAHKASLHQCISNLLTNAVKFVRAGVFPEVRVWAERRDSRVRLWVQDNGIGVPEKHREHIFGIFHRTPEGECYEGTGIGLAIVRKAVERMGGQTGVESEVGKGSRFWIELAAGERP